jgi:hypothetical protein
VYARYKSSFVILSDSIESLASASSTNANYNVMPGLLIRMGKKIHTLPNVLNLIHTNRIKHVDSHRLAATIYRYHQFVA